MNKSRKSWLLFMLITTSIVLIQVISPKYENNRIIPIIWLILSVLPPSIYILGGRYHNFNSTLVNYYGILIIGTLLLEPIITKSTTTSAISTLIYSLFIIINYQIILFTYRIKTESKEIFKPENDCKIDFERIRELISNNFIDDAFEELNTNSICFHKNYHNDLLLLKGKYQIQKREKNLNLTTHENIKIDDSKLLNGLLETLTNIENYCNSKSLKKRDS